MRLRAAVVLGALALAGPARASGFLIYDASAEALGQASAVTASTQEPAAVWFNPGALGFMKGGGGSVGGNLVLARNRFEPKDGGPEVSARPGTFFLPAIFAEGAVSDRLHLGIAALTAFGLGLEWPQDWVGREAAIKVNIATFGINPAAGFRLTDRIGIGAGFQAVRATVDFTNALPALVGGTVRVGAGTWGYGGNVALLVKAIPEKLHLGLTYRSRVLLRFHGRADFDPNPEFASSLPDQGGKADLTLPDIITAGVMWRPTARLALGFDPDVALWQTYDKLVLDFDTAPDKVFQRHFHPALTARLGGDWTSSVEGLHLRGGLIYDQNPSPKDTLAPSLPDAHRLEAAVGIGYRRGWFKADLAYLFVYFLPSESTGGTEGPEGTYRTISHLIGITVGAQFGR